MGAVAPRFGKFQLILSCSLGASMSKFRKIMLQCLTFNFFKFWFSLILNMSICRTLVNTRLVLNLVTQMFYLYIDIGLPLLCLRRFWSGWFNLTPLLIKLVVTQINFKTLYANCDNDVSLIYHFTWFAPSLLWSINKFYFPWS